MNEPYSAYSTALCLCILFPLLPIMEIPCLLIFQIPTCFLPFLSYRWLVLPRWFLWALHVLYLFLLSLCSVISFFICISAWQNRATWENGRSSFSSLYPQHQYYNDRSHEASLFMKFSLLCSWVIVDPQMFIIISVTFNTAKEGGNYFF